MHRVYDDWLDLMLYSLQRDDENYLETLEGYEEEDAHLFAEAFGELQQGMSETDADLLGVVYEDLGQSSDYFGQHFTPHNISDAMAEMHIDHVEDRKEPYTVLDPASGTGRLLMSASKIDPNGIFTGVDKDATCAKMTALNLTFFNLDGYAVHGDSLKMDYHRVWKTTSTMLGGEVRELDDSEWENPYDQAQQEDEGEVQVDPEENSFVVDRSNGEDVDFSEVRETSLSDFSGDGVQD